MWNIYATVGDVIIYMVEVDKMLTGNGDGSLEMSVSVVTAGILAFIAFQY